jgi:type II secretory pathway component GspD/PulD (secretin)
MIIQFPTVFCALIACLPNSGLQDDRLFQLSPVGKPIFNFHAERANLEKVIADLSKRAGLKVTVSPQARKLIARQRVTAHIPLANFEDALTAVALAADGPGLYISDEEGAYSIMVSDRYPSMLGCSPRYRKPPEFASKKINLEIHNAPGMKALQQLVRGTAAGYVVNENVTGTVSLKLSDVALDEAADQLATVWQGVRGPAIVCWRSGPVYVVYRFPEFGYRNSNITHTFDREPLTDAIAATLDCAGASYVLNTDLIGKKRISAQMKNVRLEGAVGNLWKIAERETTYQLSPAQVYTLYETHETYVEPIPKPLSSLHFTLNLHDADIRWAIKAVMVHAGINYTLDQDIRGPVSLKMKNAAGDKVIDEILKRCGRRATFNIQEGVYNFTVVSDPPR